MRVGEGCANTPRRNDGRSTVADGRPVAAHLHREELGGRAVVYAPRAAADPTSARRCADGLLARREESRRGAQRNDQKHGKERQDRAAPAECGSCQLHDAHQSGDSATKNSAKSPCSPMMGARGWAVASDWQTHSDARGGRVRASARACVCVRAGGWVGVRAWREQRLTEVL